MARRPRIPVETGWAHIILRGINRENLFYEKEDFAYFQKILERFLEECEVEFAVICLMSNHVHLLLWESTGNFQLFVRKVTVSYAYYYNKKLDRVGPVFQGRFGSEPINDESYLLTAARYIFQNPQKAGICRALDYPWTMLNRSGILSGYFDDEELLLDWLQEVNSDSCLEYYNAPHFTDKEILALLAELTGTENPLCLTDMGKERRDMILKQLKEKGAPVRGLSRITGLSRNVVSRA